MGGLLGAELCSLLSRQVPEPPHGAWESCEGGIAKGKGQAPPGTALESLELLIRHTRVMSELWDREEGRAAGGATLHRSYWALLRSESGENQGKKNQKPVCVSKNRLLKTLFFFFPSELKSYPIWYVNKHSLHIWNFKARICFQKTHSASGYAAYRKSNK